MKNTETKFKTVITPEEIANFCGGCENLIDKPVNCKIAKFNKGFSQARRVAQNECDAAVVKGKSVVKTLQPVL